jgi:saccharopine dehydrogenase-like NADP-dependent oxidoreductase
MRILLIGAGGVGDAIAKIAARRDFFELLVVSDYDEARARRTVDWIAARHGHAGAARFATAQVDASDPEVVASVARGHRATHVMNAVEPKFVPSVFAGALAADADYLDMAMSLSEPHPTDPYAQTGVKLGDDQFAQADDWERAGRLALVGMGVEPGLSDVFARYAADHLFSEIDELGTRDGANLVVCDEEGNEIFAPSFSIWTTIEECLNPPVVWERERGWYTTPPFSEPELFEFPEGIGPVECVNVEHEEVLLMPRWVDAKRVTFKYGLGDEFIGVLKTLALLGLDSVEPLRVKGIEVAPRDVVAAALPDPATLGDRTDLTDLPLVTIEPHLETMLPAGTTLYLGYEPRVKLEILPHDPVGRVRAQVLGGANTRDTVGRLPRVGDEVVLSPFGASEIFQRPSVDHIPWTHLMPEGEE